MVPALIVTKYTLPPAGSNDVPRAWLMEQLLTGLKNHKGTLISAPPGFGKSTLAAEAVRRSGRGAAWLSLDRGDNDPTQFGAYLAAAIRRAGLPLGEPVESLLRYTEQPPGAGHTPSGWSVCDRRAVSSRPSPQSASNSGSTSNHLVIVT